MQCDCVKDLEAKLAEHMKPQAGETAKASCSAVGFVLTDTGMDCVLNIPFRITGDKKGFTTLKGKEMPVVANFCPFCGKKAKAEEAADTPA